MSKRTKEIEFKGETYIVPKKFKFITMDPLDGEVFVYTHKPRMHQSGDFWMADDSNLINFLFISKRVRVFPKSRTDKANEFIKKI